MKEQLANIRAQALAALAAGQMTAATLDELRVKYLGKKGELTAVLKQMGKLSAEERPAMGQLANEVRAALEQALDRAAGQRWSRPPWSARLKAEAVDVTVPGAAGEAGPQAPHVCGPGRDQGHLRGHGLHRAGRPGDRAGLLQLRPAQRRGGAPLPGLVATPSISTTTAG